MRISIARKINTAAYENITIAIDVEKDMSVSEFSKEEQFVAALRKEAISHYKEIEACVMSELGLSEKSAYQESRPATNYSAQSNSVSNKKKTLSDEELADLI
jgi:hypothetical protein